MVSVPSTHLVLFIASIAVAASVAGAFTAESSRLTGTIEEVGLDVSGEVATDIEIITDPGTDVYDEDAGEVRLQVQNMGETTLPHGVEQVDVFLDGVYQPSANLTTTLLGASSWAPDVVLRIVISAPDLADTDHRVKVVVDGDEEVLEFNLIEGCGAAVRDVLVYQDPSDDDLHFLSTDGVVTDLNEPSSWSNVLMTFGPAADFDCDGLLEAPYVIGDIDDGDYYWEELRIVDANGEVQTVYDWGSENLGDNPPDFRLGSGDLDGDGVPEVVFPDPDDSEDLYRVEVGESPNEIGPGYDSYAVGGLGDFNGDGDLDLVYLDPTNEVVYLENQAESGTNVDADNDNNIGGPADFDGDGVARVPIRDEAGSEYLTLVDYQGNTEVIASNDGVQGSIATIDWDGDGTPDVVWANNNDGNDLYVTVYGGSTTELSDENGNPVDTTDLGVA